MGLYDAPWPIRALAWIASIGLLWVVASPCANLLRPPVHSTSTALRHAADRVPQSLIRTRAHFVTDGKDLKQNWPLPSGP